MGKVYHLDLNEKKTKRAKFVILPGDPERVSTIAKKFDKNYGEIAYNREFRTYLVEHKGVKILITSTGIGGPSTSIAVDELASLGVKTFLRVGTTGAIQTNINVGNVIITSGAVRLDGASTHYAPIEYPAVAHIDVVNALINAANSLKTKPHTGITASTDTFYPGQERYDSYSGYVIRRLQGSLKEWQKLNVLNYEMESATLLTLASTFGLRAGCVSGVIVNRTKQEDIKKKSLEVGEHNAIEVVIGAMKILIERESTNQAP